MDKNSKIYLAGHHGMIVSALRNSLLANGYTNIVGFPEKSPDLLDTIAVRNFFNKEKPEYVILAEACIGEFHRDEIYRADIIFQNLQIQNTVIGESFRNKVKKLIILGNISIYPKDVQQPIKEEQLLTSSLNYKNEPYAIAKIAAIKMCESFNLQYGTNFLVATTANIYGPHDNFDLTESHVIPALIRKMHLAKSLSKNNWSTLQKDLERRSLNNVNGSSTLDELIFTLHNYGISSHYLELRGSGKPMREFLWSGDLADACIFMLNNVDYTDNCNFNIGTGKEISIKKLAELIADVVGYTGRLKFSTTISDERMNNLLDVSKINDKGWKYTTELEEGIFLLYKWYLNDQVQVNK